MISVSIRSINTIKLISILKNREISDTNLVIIDDDKDDGI